jgi:hypothetical protein
MKQCWTHVSLPVLRYRSRANISIFSFGAAYSSRSQLLISAVEDGGILAEHRSKVQSCLASTPKIVLLTLPQGYCLRHISVDTSPGLTSPEESSLYAGGQWFPDFLSESISQFCPDLRIMEFEGNILCDNLKGQTLPWLRDQERRGLNSSSLAVFLLPRK